MTERITRDPVTGEYKADLSPDTPANPTLDGITKKEYDTLIDSFKNHPEYFGPDYAGTYPKGFGEAVEKVFTQAFAFNETFNQMSPEQKINMFRNTNKNREKIMSEIKELRIEKDLFDGGILISKEMSPENIFSELTGLINKSPVVNEPVVQPTTTIAKNTSKTRIQRPWKGGAWPVSSIFTIKTRNESSINEAVNHGSLPATIIGLSSAWLTGAMSYTSLAIGFLTVLGIPTGVYLALQLSCKIANMILEDNGIWWSHRISGDNLSGPIEIIKKWFESGQHVWYTLGERRGAKSKIGFALFGTICTVGDIATNLITAPFYGFAYLAKKIFNRNNAAVVPVNQSVNHQSVNHQQPTIKNKNHPNKRYMRTYDSIPIDEEDYGTPYTPLEKYNLDINNLLLRVQSVNYCTAYNAGNERQNAWMDYDEGIMEKMEKEIESMYETCGLCQQRMVSSNIKYLQCDKCKESFHHEPYRFTDNIPESNRGCGGIYKHICKELQEFNTTYGPQGVTYSSPNRKKDKCIYCTEKLGLCDDSTSEKKYTLIDFEQKMDEQTLTQKNGILTDIKNRMANNYVNLESDPPNELDAEVNLKKSNNELDTMVSTDVRQKPSGGSKKRKNKTKRRRNKKTRRHRR
jgi:hypothetical protein